MKLIDRLSYKVLQSPFLWGLIASLGFYLPLGSGLWKNQYLLRYCDANWLENVEMGLFFMALAYLGVRAVDLLRQSAVLSKSVLPPLAAPLPVGKANELLAGLDELPFAQQNGHLARRVRDALQGIVFRGSAAGLDEELKYLSESDAVRAQSAQSLVRAVIWAIPIVGVLGTVICITRVAAAYAPQVADESLAAVMDGLSTAFDTTALGLGLAMVLVFLQAFLDRWNVRFLAAVDLRTMEELSGRFELTPAAGGEATGESWRRLERMLAELLHINKLHHAELLKVAPRLADAAAAARAPAAELINAPDRTIQALAAQPEQNMAAIIEMICQFNLDVAQLQQELPMPLSLAGACNLLPARLGSAQRTARTRRKRTLDRRAAA